MSKLTKEELDESVRDLKKHLKKGQIVYTVETQIRQVSSHVRVLIITKKRIVNISPIVAGILNLKYTAISHSVIMREMKGFVTGNTEYTLVRALSKALFSEDSNFIHVPL